MPNCLGCEEFGHCLHYMEGDDDCCACEKGLVHCDSCGFVTDGGDGMCPECKTYPLCPSHEDCQKYKDEEFKEALTNG